MFCIQVKINRYIHSHFQVHFQLAVQILMNRCAAKHKVSHSVFKICIKGPGREKTCLRGFANNIGADKPVPTHSLISAFVIRLLESIISRLASSEISIFKLVSVAEETGLSLTLSETPKTGFVEWRPKLYQ